MQETEEHIATPADVKTDPSEARPDQSPQVAKKKGSSTAMQAAEAKFVGACVRLLERTSWAGCRRIGSTVGLAFFHAIPGRRRVAMENIRKAFPDLGEQELYRIARGSAQNLGITFCESLHMGAATPQQIAEYVELEGFEHLQAAMEQGKGVVLLGAHFGNWELINCRLAQHYQFTGLARPNTNAGVQAQVERARLAHGVQAISKWDSARLALKTLKQGRILALLPDQRAGKGEGLLLPMFGHITRFYTSPAQLALLSGAPIVPAFGVRRKPFVKDGRIIATLKPGFPVLQTGSGRDAREDAIEAGTRQVIAALEEIVHAHPEQWWWIHRRWRRGDAKDYEAYRASLPPGAVPRAPKA